MFHIFLWLLLTATIFFAVIAEYYKRPELFWACFITTLFIGLAIMNSGITFDYGYDIQTLDANHTTIDYNLAKSFTINRFNDSTINIFWQAFVYGSFLWIIWYLIRANSWGKEKITKKYSGG